MRRSAADPNPINSKESAGHSRRAGILLSLGAALGLALAAASLFAPPGGDAALSADIVARVNGVTIRRDNYLRAVAALGSDRRNPIDDADRRLVLDRLIDEELLVQHALALGLAVSDRRVRADLVSAVMGALLASTDGFDPSLSEMDEFYDDNLDYFTRPGRIRVREIFIGAGRRRSDDEARSIAERVVHQLEAGEDFVEVQSELGDSQIARLPDTMLPPTKLRNYLGPTAARVAKELPIGGTSQPVRSAQGYHVLWLLDREPPVTPPLEEIASEVRSELKRRRGDQALRDRLASLRASGDVIVAESLP